MATGDGSGDTEHRSATFARDDKREINMSYLFVIAEMIGAICLITALLDMGMNGSYAGWAPYGLGGAILAGVVMWIRGRGAA